MTTGRINQVTIVSQRAGTQRVLHRRRDLLLIGVHWERATRSADGRAIDA